MAETNKEDVLAEIEDEKRVCKDETELKQYNELEEIIKQIDLSILESGHSSKRRKTSSPKKNEEKILEKYEKEYEETIKQIELVKKALTTIYDMENTRFTEFVSKYGDKCNNVVKGEFIERIVENGKAIPLWIGIPDEVPPVLCGAIEADESYTSKVNDLVAALVPMTDTESNWILAKVTGSKPKMKEYTVVDIEDPRMEYILSKEKVIPLPKMRADPENNPDALFPERALVLALYPRTTCFYRAVVSQRPVGPDDPYQLYFEDPLSPSGYSAATEVHQRYVINCKVDRDNEGEADIEVESEKDE